MAGATTSDFLYHEQMETVLHGVAPATYTNTYISLHTGQPNLDGTTNQQEVQPSRGYARIAVSSIPGNWDVSSLVYSNNGVIQFGVPNTTNWGNIQYVGMYDALTGGNLLFIAALTTSKQVNVGDGAPKILAGQLRIDRASC